MIIEIDSGSGFCFGVTTAIEKAEEILKTGSQLSCLGDIVHNGMECERLRKMGLKTIDKEEFAKLHDKAVLLRAHGEPPSTYDSAKQNNITIIDATCPVVLALQKRIKKRYEELKSSNEQRKIDSSFPSVAHYDMRFLKPIDEDILHEVGKKFKRVITIEDGVVSGGLGSAVLEFFADHGYQVEVERMGIPDAFVEHGTVAQLRAICKMDAEAIKERVCSK